jgi:hypothetical protein
LSQTHDLLEIEQRRSRRALRKHQKQQKRKQKRSSALDAPLAISNANQVLTFREWCQLNRISERTGRRILKSDNGPVVTRLTDKKIGVTVGNNAAWQAARARA